MMVCELIISSVVVAKLCIVVTQLYDEDRERGGG